MALQHLELAQSQCQSVLSTPSGVILPETKKAVNIELVNILKQISQIQANLGNYEDDY